MLHADSIALALVGYALSFGGVEALSRRTSESGNDTFDGFGSLEAPLLIEQDQGGTLRYLPPVSVISLGESTGESVVIGVERASGPNLATNLDASQPNITLSSLGGCTHLKETFFACTQISLNSPTANLPLACTLTIEALGTPAQPDKFIEAQTFEFTPVLQAVYDPLRITSKMQHVEIALPPALRYKVSRRSSDVDALGRAVRFVKQKSGLLGQLLSPILETLVGLFGTLSDAAVKVVLDNVVYETGVACSI